MKTIFNDGSYYAKAQFGELTVLRKGWCNFEFRLCDVEISREQAREYLGSNFSNTELERYIMEK